MINKFNRNIIFFNEKAECCKVKSSFNSFLGTSLKTLNKKKNIQSIHRVRSTVIKIYNNRRILININRFVVVSCILSAGIEPATHPL